MTVFDDLRDILIPTREQLLTKLILRGKNSFSEQGVPIRWNHDIPVRPNGGLHSLPSVKVSQYVEVPRQIHEWSMESSCLPFFLLLADQGLFTKQMYQPDCNHRKLDMAFWWSYRTGENESRLQPLINSVFRKTVTTDLTASSPVLFVPYQVRACHDINGISAAQVCSTNTSLEVAGRDNLPNIIGRGMLNDRYAAPLTNEGFARTL